MARFELPQGLPPDEARALLAALEEYVRSASTRPSPWALAGRAEGLGLGALQIRFQSLKPWAETRLNPYTRRGSDPRIGRGDAR
jgi:hypothetical protein